MPRSAELLTLAVAMQPRAGAELPQVLLTRPAAQAAALLDAFAAAGISAAALPMLETQALILPETGPASALGNDRSEGLLAPDSLRYLDALWPHADTLTAPFDCALFVSANAVQHTAALLTGLGIDPAQCWLAKIPCLGMGDASAAAIRQQGWQLDTAAASLPAAYDSETLLRSAWAERLPAARVLLCRGRGGRALLADALAAQAESVAVLETYQRACPPYAAAERQLLLAWLSQASGQQRCVLLGSSATAEHFIQQLQRGLAEAEPAVLADLSAARPATMRLLVPSKRVASDLAGWLSADQKLEMILPAASQWPDDLIDVVSDASDAAMLAHVQRLLG